MQTEQTNNEKTEIEPEEEEIHHSDKEIPVEEKKELIRINRNYRVKIYEQEKHKCPKCKSRREVKHVKFTFDKPGKYILKINYMCSLGCELNNLEEDWQIQEVGKSLRFEELEEKHKEMKKEFNKLKKQLKTKSKEEKKRPTKEDFVESARQKREEMNL